MPNIIEIPGDVADILEKVAEDREAAGDSPADILQTVDAYQRTGGGPARLMLAENATERDALGEVDTVVKRYIVALGVPGGRAAIWLEKQLEDAGQVIADTLAFTAADVSERTSAGWTGAAGGVLGTALVIGAVYFLWPRR